MTAFLFQSDAVSAVEKATVRQASMLADPAFEIRHASLADVRSANVVPSPEWVPLGTVEFVRAWCQLCGLPVPEPLDYPATLRTFLRRDVRLIDPSQGPFQPPPPGWWIKPYSTKAWNAAQVAHGQEWPNTAFWASPNVPLRAEWRVYVCEGESLGYGRYDDGPGPDDMPLDVAALTQDMIHAFEAEHFPAAYALDVGLDCSGHALLVEVSDAWALGYYRGSCRPTDYARMLAVRWQEITAAHAPAHAPALVS